MDEVCDLVLEEERAEPDEVDRNGLEDAEREVSARELGPGFRHRVGRISKSGSNDANTFRDLEDR